MIMGLGIVKMKGLGIEIKTKQEESKATRRRKSSKNLSMRNNELKTSKNYFKER